MSLGPIGVSSASASTSLSTSNQSLSFNPIITLASPESSVSQRADNEQGFQQDQRATTEAKAETKLPSALGLGGGDSTTGMDPLAALASNLFKNPATGFKAGDLAAGYAAGGGASSGGLSPFVLLAGAGAIGLVLYLKKARA